MAKDKNRLGVGFVGSGFITRFHIRSWQTIRDADILGVWSPNGDRAHEAADLAREVGVGQARAFDSITAMAGEVLYTMSKLPSSMGTSFPPGAMSSSLKRDGTKLSY